MQIGEPARNGRDVDWTGVQINEFLIVERIPWKEGWNNSKYKCVCVNCGKVFIRYPSDIKRIKHKDCIAKDKYIGKQYGKLKIIDRQEEDIKHTGRKYLCECVDCGFRRWSFASSIIRNNHVCQTYPHIGEKIGVFDIIDALPKEKDKDVIYVAKCRECGKIKKSTYNHLLRDCKDICTHVTKFGTIKVDTHYWSNLRIRDIFYGMLMRCYDEESTGEHWKYYGGKGIKVCDEWRNNPKLFEEWSLSHGYEDELTIDRIDSDKDYCPENCRWITLSENTIRANAVFITVNNETHTQKEWCEILGVHNNKVSCIRRKYGIEAVVQYIKDKLDGKETQFDYKSHSRKIHIEVDGMRKTQSEWNKYLKCGKDTIGAYYRKHSLEETQQHIRDMLKAKEQNNDSNTQKIYIEVDGIKKSQGEWNRYLGLSSSTISAYAKKHTPEEIIEYIRHKLKNKNS